MGKIMMNNVPYASTYDNATSVKYDNTKSQLGATNVQDAIDELVDNQYKTNVNLTQLSNPNLLINGDFRNPINQEGKTTYTDKGTPVYTIDMWRLGGGAGRTVTVNDGYISLYNNSTTYDGYWVQLLEFTLPEDDYTVTVNVKRIDSTARVHFGGQLFYLVEGINVFTVHAPITDVTIAFGLNGTTELYWIKLEQGTVSTPIVPRLYAEELMLCKRYYYRYKMTDMAVLSDSAGWIYYPVEWLHNMRVERTFSCNFATVSISHGDGSEIECAIESVATKYNNVVLKLAYNRYTNLPVNVRFKDWDNDCIIIDARMY